MQSRAAYIMVAERQREKEIGGGGEGERQEERGRETGRERERERERKNIWAQVYWMVLSTFRMEFLLLVNPL
jgi:hypothetical protein